MYVSANGHVGILRLLLSHDQSRDAVYIRDARGSSAQHDAAEQGQVRCLRLLVESTGGKRQLLHQANEVCVGGQCLVVCRIVFWITVAVATGIIGT